MAAPISSSDTWPAAGDELALEQLLRWQVQRLLDSGDLRIPPLPQLALELKRIAESDYPDLGEAVQLVKRDAQVAARVLRVARSAAYSRGFNVSSLDEAAVRIGVNGLRGVAFAISLGEVFRCGPLVHQVRETQRHSFVVAEAASYAAALVEADSEVAFLCGLFHDVGRQLIYAALAQIGTMDSRWLAPETVTQPFLALHQELGATVALHWSLPPAVVEIAGFHHDPSCARAGLKLAHLVGLADVGDHLQAADAVARGAALARLYPAGVVGVPPEQIAEVGELIGRVREDAKLALLTS